MGKRSMLLFVHKHRMLLSVLSFVFVQLPGSIDSAWSLIERLSGVPNADGGVESMSLTWLYWVTVPLGLGVFGLVMWLTRKPILGKAEKSRITELMASVNAIDDRMSRCFNDLIEYESDRLPKYRDMINSPDFKGLWDRCSEQRAKINAISPELGEQVRLLLMVLQTSYSHLLKDWYISELPKFEKDIERHVKTTEAIRRRIRKTIEKLTGW